MTRSNIKKIYKNFIHTFPLILLFFFSFTGFDLSFFLFDNNYSFNFIYAIIFYWVLKKPDRLGYGLIFLVGIINDVVQNFPIGISPINYLFLCAIAAFIRTRTLMPSLLYDWILFFIAILIVSSVNFTILTIIFDYPIKYGTLMFGSFITFLIYPILSKLFNQITKIELREENAN
tara:strand:+ start:115 stop:639 length:525 start_codon:yes stop_codon:yes gene_type:complete